MLNIYMAFGGTNWGHCESAMERKSTRMCG